MQDVGTAACRGETPSAGLGDGHLALLQPAACSPLSSHIHDPALPHQAVSPQHGITCGTLSCLCPAPGGQQGLGQHLR